MKKYIRILLAATVALASCINDGPIVIPAPGDGEGDSELVTIAVSVPGGTSVKTRAIAHHGAADNAIADLVFLLFDEATEVYRGYAVPESISEPKLDPDSGDTANKNLYEVAVKFPKSGYKAIVVVNYLTLSGSSLSQSELSSELNATMQGKKMDDAAEFFGSLTYFTTRDTNESTEGRQSDFYMADLSAENCHPMAAYYTVPEPDDRGTMPQLDLTRSIAKIDLDGSAVASDFAISEVRLVNAQPGFKFMPLRNPPATPSIFDAAHLNPKAGTANSGFIYGSERINTTDNTLIDNIFLPEVAVPAGINEDNLSWNNNWKGAVALLIKGRLTSTGTDRWFRVNLRMNNEKGTPTTTDDALQHVNIVRNHRYTINIKGVEGRGYDSWEEAYDALPGDLVINLVAIPDDDLTEFVYNGQYYLGVSALDEFESWESIKIDGYKLEQSLKIHTDYPGGWKVESVTYDDVSTDANIVDDAWFANESELEASAHNPYAFGVETVTVKTKTNHGPTVRRTATITISAGSLKIDVPVAQKPGGILATPGMIGYAADSHTLTLRGSKEFADNSSVKAQAEAMFPSEGLYDETVYVAYYKWGSLVAIDSETSLLSADNIVWAPPSYTYDGFSGTEAAKALIGGKVNGEAWKAIPTRTESLPGEDTWMPDGGALGDPCSLIPEGRWKLLAEKDYENFMGKAGTLTPGDGYYTYTPAQYPLPALGTFLQGTAKGSSFPIAGERATTGYMWPGEGYAWLSGPTMPDMGYAMRYSSSYAMKTSMTYETLPVRCVKIPPGIHASPGVIGYKLDGTLTLKGSSAYVGTDVDPAVSGANGFGALENEPVYVAYFKWGSMVATGTQLGTFSAEDVVWAPDDYTYNSYKGAPAVRAQIGSGSGQTAWDMIPSRTGADAVANGWSAGATGSALGDPCSIFEGDWQMPSGHPWNGGTFGSQTINDSAYGWRTATNPNNWIGAKVLAPDLPAGARAGLDSDPDWSMFLPAAGHRKSDGSIPSQTQGYYWSTAAHDETVASILHFYSAGAAPAEKMNSLYTNGMAVRCVEAIPEGVRAVPGMIGYYANGDNEGQITLDGDDGDNNDVVLAAYFKFGSMVALNQNTAPFSAADVLATPSEYDESKITNWASVPYLTGPVSDDPENGTGDPCAYYFGSNGGWKTPTTTEMQSNFFIGSSASVVTNPSTSNPVWLMHGSEKVLPAAGARNSSTGLIEERGEYGYYWTSTDWSNINGGWILYFYSGQVGTPNSNTLMGNSYGNGHPVRCVQEVPGIKAPRGVIGYIKDTNELTLEGDKDLPGSTQTKETVYVAYFKFGSLIATSSQDNDEEFTPADIVHVPDDYDGLSSITDWTNVPYKSGGSYAGSSTTVNYWEEDADSSAGLGDPCIYYFEDNDGGTGSGGWRLPTTAENIAYVGRDGTSPSSSGENPEYHNWIPNNTNVINPGVETFPKSNVQGAWLPAAGQRIYNASEGKVAGSITNQGSSGLYWSSRASSATSGSYLSFNSTWVHPNNTTNKQYGYAVRCVPTYIPSPGGEVIVGDIAWAKANVAEPGTFAATEYMYDTNIHSWVESRTAGLPQGVCPDGWRLPTKAEFQTLIDRATNSDTSGSAQGQWITSSNTYGRKLIIPEGEIFLSASGGDIHDGNGHDGQGGAAFYLTSESDGNTTTGILQFGPSWCDMTNSGTHTDYSISVRCVRDL